MRRVTRPLSLVVLVLLLAPGAARAEDPACRQTQDRHLDAGEKKAAAKDTAGAQAEFDLAAKAAVECGDITGLFRANNAAASYFYQHEQWDAALPYKRASLHVLRTIGTPAIQAGEARQLSTMLVKAHEFDAALSYALEAVSQLYWVEDPEFAKNRTDALAEATNVLMGFGIFRLEDGKKAKGIDFLKESLFMARASKDKELIRISLEQLTKYAPEEGKKAAAGEEFPSKYLAMMETFGQAGQAQQKGEFDEATKLLKKAQRQGKRFGDKRFLGLVMWTHAELAEQQKDAETAAKFYDLALQQFREIGDGFMMSRVYLSMAAAADKAGDKPKTLELCTKMHEQAPVDNHSLTNLALAHHQVGNTDQARTFVRLARLFYPRLTFEDPIAQYDDGGAAKPADTAAAKPAETTTPAETAESEKKYYATYEENREHGTLVPAWYGVKEEHTKPADWAKLQSDRESSSESSSSSSGSSYSGGGGIDWDDDFWDWDEEPGFVPWKSTAYMLGLTYGMGGQLPVAFDDGNLAPQLGLRFREHNGYIGSGLVWIFIAMIGAMAGADVEWGETEYFPANLDFTYFFEGDLGGDRPALKGYDVRYYVDAGSFIGGRIGLHFQHFKTTFEGLGHGAGGGPGEYNVQYNALGMPLGLFVRLWDGRFSFHGTWYANFLGGEFRPATATSRGKIVYTNSPFELELDVNLWDWAYIRLGTRVSSLDEGEAWGFMFEFGGRLFFDMDD